MSEQEIASQIIGKTSNDILFLVIILLVLGAPIVYFLMRQFKSMKADEWKHQEEHQAAEIEERKQLMSVIERNSTVIAKVEANLTSSNERIMDVVKQINESNNETALKVATLVTDHGFVKNKLGIIEESAAKANRDIEIMRERARHFDDIKESAFHVKADVIAGNENIRAIDKKLDTMLAYLNRHFDD